LKGAHEGVGLGDRFLGHAERCASILHLIDGTGDNIAKTYKTIRAELEAYGHGLDEKARDRGAEQGRMPFPNGSSRKSAPRWKSLRPQRCM
jgi:hypothetical protein